MAFSFLRPKEKTIKLKESDFQLLLKSLSFQGLTQIGGIPVSNSQTADSIQKYCTVDDLYSIIRKITKTCKRIPIYAYVVTDAKKFGKYQLLAKNYNRTRKGLDDVMELKYQSMELLGDMDEMQQRIDNPNEQQTKDEFLEAAYIMPLITGERFIWKESLLDGANAGKAGALWILPSNLMQVNATGSFPAVITGYQINSPFVKKFANEEISFTKYYNPEFTNVNGNLRGLSPVGVAAKLMQQSSRERDYSNASLANAGAYGAMVAPGITANGISSQTISALGTMKTDFYKEIGSSFSGDVNQNARKIAMLAGDWKYLQFGISPADMDLINQNKVTFKKMCNVFGVSDILFNNDTASTESNVANMVKQMVINACLPEVQSLVHSLNKSVAPAYQKGNYKKVYAEDISDMPELQEDISNVLRKFSDAPAFRVNDLMEAIGYGRLDDPNADIVMVKNGYVPLDELAAQYPDIQPTGDYANTGNN